MLFQTDYDPGHLSGLIAKSWNSSVLDSGATKTISGQAWLDTYLSSLPDSSSITWSGSNNIYHFRDGHKVQAMKSATIPVVLGGHKVHLTTDVIAKDIPLLISRDSMKKAGMTIDFENDIAKVFGKTINLNVTKSGHYTLPLTPATQFLVDYKIQPRVHTTLVCNSSLSKKDIAHKLHRQFAHAPSHKLLALIADAGHPWANDHELKDEIKALSASCRTCHLHQKTKPKPAVALPTTSNFQEVVAMDLKFFDGKILLHMIDHTTQLSAYARIPSK